MIAMMIKKEIDFALGPFGVSGDRASVVDFSTPLFVDKQIISYSRPKLEPDLLGFIRPFDTLMWLLIFLAFILVVLSACGILLARKLLGRREENREFRHPSEEDLSEMPILYITWIYGILLGQSFSVLNKNNTTWMLVGIWLVATFIIGTVYKSNLKAMLIIPKVNIPFNNLEELVNQNDVPFILMGGSLVHTTFMEAEQGTLFARAYEKSSGVTWTYNEGLRKILQEKFAIIVDYTTIMNILHSFFSKTTQCPLWLTKEGIMSYMLSVSFPKHSSLKDRFDPVIIRLREGGILDLLLKKQTTNATYCLLPPGSEAPENNALQVRDMYGVFSLFLLGVGLSLIAFLGELIVGCGKKRSCSFRLNDSAETSTTRDEIRYDIHG
ncbi:uncharacterized protein LOC135215223 [Macrobrachium nipponense]|uniref:uncharacterized protein LOC135215223 n=1 Tax=Macrobrachium nipponense TaxID=159736 RepID=UPI0030C8C857